MYILVLASDPRLFLGVGPRLILVHVHTFICRQFYSTLHVHVCINVRTVHTLYAAFCLQNFTIFPLPTLTPSHPHTPPHPPSIPPNFSSGDIMNNQKAMEFNSQTNVYSCAFNFMQLRKIKRNTDRRASEVGTTLASYGHFPVDTCRCVYNLAQGLP